MGNEDGIGPKLGTWNSIQISQLGGRSPSAASLAALAGAWIANGTARGGWHCTQQLGLLCQNTSQPEIIFCTRFKYFTYATLQHLLLQGWG